MLGEEQDIQFKIDLISDEKAIIDNKTQRILDVTQQFNLERQNSRKFRLQGQIECISPITGIFKDTTTVSGLYDYKTSNDLDSDFYTIKDFFNLTILYPSKFIKQSDGSYNLLLKPIISNKIDFINSGFYVNMFYEQIYQFIVEEDIDITDLYLHSDDNRFRLPVNELFIFINFYNIESKFVHNYQSINPTTGIVTTKIGNISPTEFNDGIYGGNYNLDFTNYDFTINSDSVSNIYFKLSDRTLKYNYTPFKTVDLQVFSENLETGNINTTENIPYYGYILDDETNNFSAKKTENFINTEYNVFSGTTRLTMDDPLYMLPRKLIFNTNNNLFEYYLDNEILDNSYFNMTLNGVLIENGVEYILSETQRNKIIFRIKINLNDIINCNYLIGENYVWKDLLDIGYIEPNSELGVNYPFVNGFHYIFKDNKFVITPDMTDTQTNNQYCRFEFNLNNDGFTNKALDSGNC